MQASKKSVLDSNIKLKKSLGQNFLTEKNIVNKIVNTANVDDSTIIFEIGPGIGALTQVMLESAHKVIAIEIDQRLIPILKTKFEGPNFELINEDFLKIKNEDLENFVKQGYKIKVVANLPYYITSAIITKILLTMPFIDEIYIMVQKEVAQRISASYKTKQYNSLSVLCQSLSDVKYEFTVSKTVFEPVPKVDSAIISLKRKECDIDILNFEIFVQNCFKQKRKTLINNLNAAYSIEKEKLISFLENLNIDSKIRAEHISVKSFENLYNEFICKF